MRSIWTEASYQGAISRAQSASYVGGAGGGVARVGGQGVGQRAWPAPPRSSSPARRAGSWWCGSRRWRGTRGPSARPSSSVKVRSRLRRPVIGRTPPIGCMGRPCAKKRSGPGSSSQARSKRSGSERAVRRSLSAVRMARVTDRVSPSPGMPRNFTKPRSPPSLASTGTSTCGLRYQRDRYISPLSWMVSGISTPTSASHPGTSPRRPVHAITMSASTVLPSAEAHADDDRGAVRAPAGRPRGR